MRKAREATFSGGLISTPGKLQEVYLGIDQSYTGFATTFLAPDGKHHTSVYESPQGMRPADRLVNLQDHLEDRMEWAFSHGLDVQSVAMEGYASYATTYAAMAGELGGAVKICLQGKNLYPWLVPPTNLKKYVTGKGTGVNKSLILLSVYKNWGADFTDDNAADSYVLARIALHLARPSMVDRSTFSNAFCKAQDEALLKFIKDPDKYRA